MKKIFYFFILCFISVLIGSCAALPKTKTEPSGDNTIQNQDTLIEQKTETIPHKTQSEVRKQPEKIQKTADEEIIAQFEGISITKKDKEIAKSEIEEVVKKLNDITAKKDYGRWTYYLSADYKREFSKLSFLKKASDGLPAAAKGKQLKNLEDYFYYVFVPSRQHGRVDDIVYISPTRVRVLKILTNQTLIFYNLEKIDGRWLLVP